MKPAKSLRPICNHVSTFSGKYYQLEKCDLEPKPVQKNLPLMIGGGGEKGDAANNRRSCR